MRKKDFTCWIETHGSKFPEIMTHVLYSYSRVITILYDNSGTMKS